MKGLLCIGLMLIVTTSFAQLPLSPRVANYEMHVSLDTENKKLHATTHLTWINPSPDTIRELQFHLYYNGFKNNMSTWMQEDWQFMEFVGEAWYEECNWSWSVIRQIQDELGNDLSQGMEFIHPDDDNNQDQSVLRVPLSQPVMPYDTAHFNFTWSARFPKTMVRTGYNRDFHFFAQWFPKLGVYEPAGMRCAETGGWNCHQYHADGEYYADFGEYIVHLTVPEDYTVGASGFLKEKKASGDQTNTWTFHATDVIDFAWTTSPHSVIEQMKWKDVDISVIMYPEHRPQLPRYMESITYVMEFLDKHVGDYPYPNLTIVDPPFHGMFMSAMEYPTLITSLSTPLLPKGFHSTETLVVHEFIHQYFMQMVATNEMEETWMDEGITNYYEARIMDEYYGEKTSMFNCYGLRIGNSEHTRYGFFASGHAKLAPNTNASWEFPNGSYTAISYNKVALWMKTLEGLIGVEVMDEAMRTYFERWKFKHPCGDDFVAVMNEVVSRRLPERYPDGMDWYFDQVLKGTDVCDYAVESVTNLPVEEPLGYIEDTITCLVLVKKNDKENVQYNARVMLYRLGEITVPVEINITFDDGSTALEHWDGKSRSKELRYTGSRRITGAEIDPERKIYLDLNFINNSKTASLQRTGLRSYFVEYLNTAQHLIESLSFLM